MGEKLPAKAADNWDLQAVVSCFSISSDSTKNSATPQQINTTTTIAAATAADENSSDPLAFLANMEFDEEDDDPFSFPSLSEKNNGFDELQDSCRPFFSTPSSFPERQQLNTNTVSSMNSSSFQQVLQQQPLIQQQQQLQPVMPSQAPRSRKRKTPIKKMVCQVKCEQLSMDTWAWRKYGQKPIKGSPYPRNYYRCSSSKGCGARKQVERSNTDPGFYIVSYTGDHTHPRPTRRNSLAGSTRNKFSRRTHTIANNNSSSSPPAAACQPPSQMAPPAKEADHKDNKGFMEEEEEVDDLFQDLLIPNLAAPAIDEDFFKGLKQFSTTTASGSSGNDG